MTCALHPDNILFLNGECLTCFSKRKLIEKMARAHQQVFSKIPDRLLADVVVTPVAQAEEILRRKAGR